MRILLTGSKGQLGNELQDILMTGRSEIGRISYQKSIKEIIAVDIDELDISNFGEVWSFVTETHKPDVIINCGAYTNVDGCETNIDTAFQANSRGPENLAKAARELGARFIHVSTDYVFAGDRKSGIPYREWDLTDPQGVYGMSKLMGEQLAQTQYPSTSVVRTSWLYGYVGNNFVKTILGVAYRTGKLKVVNDQFGNPTNANDLAHHIIKLIDAPDGGIYHCTGEGICSWFDFASEFLTLSGLEYTIEPCSSDEFPSPTKRPSFSALDNMCLRNSVGNEMRDWKTAIKEYMTHYHKETGEILK